MIRAVRHIWRYAGILLYVGVLIVSGNHNCYAQQLPFHSYTMRDGLVSDYITYLYQDSRQYLWIGTTEGLSVFDGLAFRNYTPADGLPFPYVDAIIEDRRSPGTMWIGTDGKGVCKLTAGKIEDISLGTHLGDKKIFSIAQDHNGTIWTGTAEEIYLIRNDSIIAFHPEIKFGPVPAIVESADGNVWIGSNAGLFLFNPHDNTVHRVIESSISALCLDDEGDLWIGSGLGDVSEMQKGIVVAQKKISQGSIASLFDDHQGNIWCTAGNVLKIDKSSTPLKIVPYTAQKGLPDDNMITGIVDKENSIWLGGATRGIVRLTGQDVYRYTSDSLAQKYNNGTAVCDPHGHLWVAARSTLWEVWNNGRDNWQRVIHRISPPVKEVMLTQDSHGHLWIGSDGGNISCYEIQSHGNAASGMKLIHQIAMTTYSHSPLLCFIVDKDGMLWCSTVDNGVIVLDPARQNLLVRHMNVQDGLPDISLRALFQDNKGNIWFGGYAQGLALLPYGERFTGKAHSPVPPGALLDNGVRAIVQDTAGHIWIGLRYGGLAEIQNDSIHSYSVKDGLISNGVWAIAFDSVGRMMIGTQLGLGYCDLRNSMYFTRNADFTGPVVFSCGMMGNDYAWFIGGEGLTLYKEKIKLSDTIAPAVYITHFQMNGKDVTPASDMRFAYDQNNFVIDYVGVDLKDARAIRYEYRMLNADEQWRSPTSMREVTYAALAPGTYRFEVRAINANGVKSIQPAIIAFTIVPPFWQRWWFIIATVIAVVVVAILVIRGRVRRLLEIERIRSRIATDLHDDIGSGLTRIAIFSDVASRQISALKAAGGNDDPFVAATSIKKVGNIARELVDAMGDVVWSIDPKQDSMHELISRIRIFAFELCEAKNISLSFEIGKGVEQVKLSSEIKRGILLLVKEALTNVVRHSGCSTVRIEAKLHGQSLNIHVIDNGKGFDASVASFGNGLTNMRKRVEKIGGRFVIASSPDSGTDVDVIIPVTEKTAHLFS